MNLRGQYFSFDAIISSIIFILAIFMLFSYWHSVRVSLDYQSNVLFREALRISDLAFTPGYPEGEGCELQSQAGFAISWNEKKVSKEKIICADVFDGAAAKAKFSSPYSVSIVINDGVYIIGENPRAFLDIANVAKIRRIAAMRDETGNEEIITLDVYVYN